MAELNLGKGLTAGKVASNVQKKLTRAQEKVRSRLSPFLSMQEMWSCRSSHHGCVLIPLRQCRIPGRVSHHDTRPLSQSLVRDRLASTPKNSSYNRSALNKNCIHVNVILRTLCSENTTLMDSSFGDVAYTVPLSFTAKWKRNNGTKTASDAV